MSDPVTIGTLAASALSIAGGEAAKGFVSEAVKDAYKVLKDKIVLWAGSDIEALEKTPTLPVGWGIIQADRADFAAVLVGVKSSATIKNRVYPAQMIGRNVACSGLS